MAREMLINTLAGQECRIAIVGGAGLEEYYVERASRASRVGNIYKGRVTNVEPAIQAAFVDFGLSKNGFLHVSDLHPQYFPRGQQSSEPVGRKRPHKDRPPIQECLRRGQEVIVQMTKEGIGSKGPTLTSYVSIPGRLLVMMPGMTRLGVSRKIEDEEARTKARALLGQLKLPGSMGFIVRTAGLERSKRDLQRDLNYLLRLWKIVKDRTKAVKAPAEIYKESDLVIRTLRDIYDTGIDRILCDSASVARRVEEFLNVAMPRTKHAIEVYTGKEGLYHDFGLEEEIEKIYSPRVELPSGGSLVIDQTEALVAIDVNSGRFREHADAETTALKINVEAAREMARQLRLRDLGGVIIIDFIDMREEKNRRTVERALRQAIRPDRAKTRVLRISRLGIVEMTRQRIGPSLETTFCQTCTYCNGTGMIRSDESQALLILRDLRRATSVPDVSQVEVCVTPTVAQHLSNYQRRHISQLEADTGISIIVRADTGLAGDEVKVVCRNNRGSVLAWEQKARPSARKKHIPTVPLAKLPAAPGPGEERAAPQTPQDMAKEPKQAEAVPPAPQPKKARRRRRGGKKHKRPPAAEDKEVALEAPPAEHSPAAEQAKVEPKSQADAPERRRRRKRRKKAAAAPRASGDASKEAATLAGKPPEPAQTEAAAKPQPDPQPPPAADSATPPAPKKKRRRRRKASSSRQPADAHQPPPGRDAAPPQPDTRSP